MGWGKSSFVNTCFMATETQTFIPTVPADSPKAKDSVTQLYTCYQLKGTNIWLYDTYGWEVNPNSNYSVDQFRSYLRGMLPLNTHRNSYKESNNADSNLIIDAVIFVISAEFCKLSDSSAPAIETYWNTMKNGPGLKDFYEVAYNMDKKITILLSKIDTVIPGVAKYTQLKNGTEFEELKRYIQNTLRKEDASTVILPLSSYKAEFFQGPRATRNRIYLNELSAACALIHNTSIPTPDPAPKPFYWTAEVLHGNDVNNAEFWPGGKR